MFHRGCVSLKRETKVEKRTRNMAAKAGRTSLKTVVIVQILLMKIEMKMALIPRLRYEMLCMSHMYDNLSESKVRLD